MFVIVNADALKGAGHDEAEMGSWSMGQRLYRYKLSVCHASLSSIRKR